MQESSPLPTSARIPTIKYFGNAKGSNLLTSVTIKYIKLIGGHAIRINSMGVPRKGRNGQTIWTKGSSSGIADIQAMLKINGQPVTIMIEIKRKKEKLLESQIKYRDNIEKVGGVYLVARNLDMLMEYIETLKTYRISV